jgi:hypothetical protein
LWVPGWSIARCESARGRASHRCAIVGAAPSPRSARGSRHGRDGPVRCQRTSALPHVNPAPKVAMTR